MVLTELIAAVIIAAIAVLTATGRARRNRFVGVRTAATTRNDGAWRRAHRAALLPTVVSSALTVLTALVFVACDRPNDPLSVVICAALLLAGVVWGGATADRAARA